MENIYIELDGLFDTRLPIISSLDENIAIEYFNSDKYDLRNNDTFNNIPYKVFEVYYKDRKKEILNYALPTNIFKVIENINIDFVSDLKNVEVKVQTLYINSYPYFLDEDEKEKFKEYFLNYIKSVDIEFIYVDNYNLTSKYLDEIKVKHIVKYDGMEWMEKQNGLGNLIENPLIGKELYVPAIFNEKINLKIDKDFFLKLSKSLNIFTNVFFTDIYYWNAINSKKIKK